MDDENWLERNSTIALPSAALPYLYSWLFLLEHEDPAPSPTAISASLVMSVIVFDLKIGTYVLMS